MAAAAEEGAVSKSRADSEEGEGAPPPEAPAPTDVPTGPENLTLYVHGYLHKKTRDGRWQKRWFETNGCFLTYYKNKKMTKLLAALNLPQVGDIKLLPSDHPDDVENTGALFSIELNDRQYMLRATKKEDAEMWVEKLTMLKKNPQVAVAVNNPVADTSAMPDSMRDSADAEAGTPGSWQKTAGCCPCPSPV